MALFLTLGVGGVGLGANECGFSLGYRFKPSNQIPGNGDMISLRCSLLDLLTLFSPAIALYLLLLIMIRSFFGNLEPC
ncbi:hypothetical protein Lalb_Chr07g0179191 [Lupinus albus]|uniref:Transmembrane protein n=1 Tax=Lupinus albus TaxID=3870 RepID=A0A6A4Q6E7_LUPAL|nr:hypothetical protein Lalb_Chr07g0179191 [Lupinus albus]